MVLIKCFVILFPKLSINLYSLQLACENCPCEVVRARILSRPCESRFGHSSNPSSSFKSKFNDDTDCHEMKFLIGCLNDHFYKRS